MPVCKGGKGFYTGHEPSPKGRGFCARYEKIGTKKRGKDKKMWIVRSVKLAKGKRSRRWFRVRSKSKPKKPIKRKANTTTRKKNSKKIRGGVNSKEAKAAQMICDVLRLYIPVYAFEKIGKTIEELKTKIRKKIKLHIVHKQFMKYVDQFQERKDRYILKLDKFNHLLAELDPRVSVGIREVFVNKRNQLKDHMHGMTKEKIEQLIYRPENAYDTILKHIGCENAVLIDRVIYGKLDLFPKHNPEYEKKFYEINFRNM